MNKIEINTNNLIKSTRTIPIRATATRKGHRRTIKSGNKDITPSEIESIKGYTAKGGIMASKFTCDRKVLLNYLNTTKPNAVGKMIHRGVGMTDKEWEGLFEKWTEPGRVIKNDRISSFTLNPRRAPIHCVGEQRVIFSIKNKSGIDISKHSVYSEEEEVLTTPDFKWRVISADIIYGTTWEIIGEEI